MVRLVLRRHALHCGACAQKFPCAPLKKSKITVAMVDTSLLPVSCYVDAHATEALLRARDNHCWKASFLSLASPKSFMPRKGNYVLPLCGDRHP